ncbi:MAG: biotin/lipoyl-binding protein, partial [Rhodoferax sp.]
MTPATPEAASPAPLPGTAGRELLARYQAIFCAAWAHRHELAGPRLHQEEAAFLPAALSLQHTPVHPSPRRAAYTVMALFVIALVWACFGKIDIVSTAPGRIIVGERTKLIQPLEASVVRAVLVKDGDRVKAGQVLIELDPTMANADKASVQEQLDAALSEEQRTATLLQSLSKGELLAHVPRGLQAQLLSEWQDIRAKLAKLDAEIAHRRAEIATVRETIAKLEATVPMAQTREQDFKRLVTEGFISSHATQDKTRERVELERDLGVQRAKLVESQSALIESENTRASFQAETRRTLQDRHAVAATKVQQLGADTTKAT